MHRRARAPRQSYSAAEFDALSEKYAALNWRIVSKPGGATVKPDELHLVRARCPPPSSPYYWTPPTLLLVDRNCHMRAHPT